MILIQQILLFKTIYSLWFQLQWKWLSSEICISSISNKQTGCVLLKVLSLIWNHRTDEISAATGSIGQPHHSELLSSSLFVWATTSQTSQVDKDECAVRPNEGFLNATLPHTVCLYTSINGNQILLDTNKNVKTTSKTEEQTIRRAPICCCEC